MMKCFVCDNTKKFDKLYPDLCEVKNNICDNCGLVFVERKASMQEYYEQDGYFTKSPNISLRKEFVNRRMLLHQAKERVDGSLKILPLDLKNKSVIDVGCGYGELLYYIKHTLKGKVVGLEAGKEAAQMGEEMFKVKIHAKLLEDFKSEDKFDVVICAHTLEHVDDPNFFLQGLKRLLKPDGYLYIEVPNILKPTGGFTLNKFLYSEHLQNFSAYNLALLLRKNGLHVTVYSDEGFLKFWCQKKSTKKELNVPKITKNQIMSFLNNYQKNYSVLNHIKVYFQKFRYLVRLLLYKVIEI